MHLNDKIDLSRLVGFEQLAAEAVEAVDFREDARLGAKRGDVEAAGCAAVAEDKASD